MWTPNRSPGLESSAILGREQLLGHLLTHKNGLNLKYRKLTGVLLAASMFFLGDSPWIGPDLGSETIFVPPPDNKQLQQWCPRLSCTIGPNRNTRPQSDSIAALGVLVLELEANRKANWTADDEDRLLGEKSNRRRLARILKSWEDLVSDDCRSVATACLEFDNLIASFDYPKRVSGKKRHAVIYKFILEPLFRHAMGSFKSLTPVFHEMFCCDRTLTAPINIAPSIPAMRVMFDDENLSPNTEEQ